MWCGYGEHGNSERKRVYVHQISCAESVSGSLQQVCALKAVSHVDAAVRQQRPQLSAAQAVKIASSGCSSGRARLLLGVALLQLGHDLACTQSARSIVIVSGAEMALL